MKTKYMATSTRQHLISGVIYTAIAKYSQIVIQLVVTGILNRLLTPGEIGIVSIATIVIVFFSIFSDMGIAPAIVQNKDLTRDDLSNIFSFTVWSGLALSVLFFFSSWWIASLYDSPALVVICQWLSLNLLFATVNIVPNALLLKDKRFDFIAWRTVAVQLLTGVIAVATAYMGAGMYALLVNPILSAIALFFINIYQYPQRMRLTLGLGSMKKIFSFSSYQFLFSFINYFSRNLDKLLLGRVMNTSQLGYYQQSYRLMLMPLQNITSVLTPVMHPVFSDLQNDYARLSSSYLKIVRLLALIGFPLSVLLYFTSRELIMIYCGDQWEASIPVFEILALSVGVQMVLSSSGAIFQAANAPKVMFLSGLMSTILTVAGILVGLFWFRTIEAVAWGVCISFAINFFQCYILMYKVTFKLPLRDFFKQLYSSLALSVILIAVMWGVSRFLPAMPSVPSLFVKGSIALIVGASYVQITKELDIFALVKKMVNKALRR